MLVIMSDDNNKRYLANEVMFYSAIVCLPVCEHLHVKTTKLFFVKSS